MTYPDDPVPSEPCRARRSADTRWTPGTPTKAIFPIFPFLFFPKLPFRSDENTDLGEHTRDRAHGNVKSANETFVFAGLIFPPFVFLSIPLPLKTLLLLPLHPLHPPRFGGSRWERFTERCALKKKKKKDIYIFIFDSRTYLIFNFIQSFRIRINRGTEN